LYFPDFLFFDNEHEEDLSDFYETNQKRKVKGLISTLKEYYFTIEENTPLEQEIALDPELLGKIFENLLASYNPETRTTARKLTGSFYTPREIVNYMVDESLIAYLKTKLTEKIKAFQQLGNRQVNMFGNEGKVGQLEMQIDITASKWDNKEEELESNLRRLFAYESEENPFNDNKETTNAIIAHLSECKILDPACGSGAFPMGVLHQIVHALKKLDRNNEQWKKLQYERLISPQVNKINEDKLLVKSLSSDEVRKMAEKQLQHELEELLNNFEIHDHNYTRKLHLIQECIYGVDIQPIAIQISKLRFFISLLVDQNIDFNQREKNYLLNSLPNLETKFVAANTLIPLNPGGQLKTRENEIVKIENRIKTERRKYFDCKNRDEKRNIEKADEALRITFAAKLKELTEQGRKNLKIQIQKIEEDIELHQKYKAKIQSDKDKSKISKGIEQLKKELEKLTSHLAQFASGDEVADKILNFNPYDANTSAPFFDPEIMFALQPANQVGYFDIVIGNPPYLGHKEIGAEKQKIFKKIFGFSDDMYNYFFFKGIELTKSEGILSYISSNTYMTLSSKLNLRELLQNNQILQLIKVGYVFNEAFVDTAIMLVKKCNAKDCSYVLKIASAEKDFFNPESYNVTIDIYRKALNNIFFIPNSVNQSLYSTFNSNLKKLYDIYWNKIIDINSIKKNQKLISEYRENLKAGDKTFLGLITEGSQGLVTGNNSKYLAAICSDKEEISKIHSELINKLSIYQTEESSISLNNPELLYSIAEEIKVKTSKPSIFGKFFLYKTVLSENVKDFLNLTPQEQLNGCNKTVWVTYARGNDNGNKWHVPNADAIDWSIVSVNELKEGNVTNSRWQGSEYYNSTGFGWVDYFTNEIKCFYIPTGPYSKNVVKFHSKTFISDKFIIGLLNSKIITYYIKNFITNTHTLQVNDGKIIPIIIPNIKIHKIIEATVDKIISTCKRHIPTNIKSFEIQIDLMFYKLYALTFDECKIVDPGIEKLISREEYEANGIEELAEYEIKNGN